MVRAVQGAEGAEGAEAGGDDDDFEIVDDGSFEVEVVEAADAGAKRKRGERSASEEGAGGAEKARRVE